MGLDQDAFQISGTSSGTRFCNIYGTLGIILKSQRPWTSWRAPVLLEEQKRTTTLSELRADF
eukprot:1785660-Pyramimonas_sp.AAC.1